MFHMPSFSDFEDESFDSDSQDEKPFDEAGQALLDACRDGKFQEVKRLITKKNINNKINGETPLIAACAGGHMKVIQFLVGAGADVLMHGKDYDIFTPLHTACFVGKPALVKFLLDHGADKGVNKSGYGSRPLYTACWNRKDVNGEIMKLLIKAGAKVNARCRYGQTPLLAAVSLCWNGFENPQNFKQVEVLLKSGADPNVYDMEGNHPLMVTMGNPKVFRLLVENGADVNVMGLDGKPLYKSSFMDYECVGILLEYDSGVDVCCVHKSCQFDVLMCCYFQYRRDRNMEALKWVEEHFIKMDVAGLYFGKGTSFIVEPRCKLMSYQGKQMDEFRNKCKDEVARMSAEKIGNTSITFQEVLYQRRSAMLRLDSLPLPVCQASFPIYGGLIRSRYVMGRQKLPLIEKSMRFFELTDLPHLLPELVATILSYLSVSDLKNVISAHKPPKKDDVMSWLLGLTGSLRGPSANGDGSATSGPQPGPSAGSHPNQMAAPAAKEMLKK